MVSDAGHELLDLEPMRAPARRRSVEDLLDTEDQLSDAAAIRELAQGRRFDWIVVDHYGLDARWERSMRKGGGHILVIDDLANRSHDCDVLLDQNLGPSAPPADNADQAAGVRRLEGPRYALLRPGFGALRPLIGPREGRVERILVMYGGADPTGETVKAVKALKSLPTLASRIDVVVGSANPLSEAVRAQCREDPRVRFHFDPANVPELMAEADIALGACGTSSWERCCMYLPAIAVVVAENQRRIAAGLAEAGAAEILGWHADVAVERLQNAVEHLAALPERVRDMSRHAGEVTDGRGVERVLQTMEEVDAHSRVLR
jgi:UDP-2,4-diacetamido-2,4,6-trideoxy-beta-L-altropyranose hydrolase